MLSNAIERAQMKIENNNYGIRENLLKYDEVNNEQREVIYEERNKVLEGDNMHQTIMQMVNDIIEHAVDMSISDDLTPDNWNYKELNELLQPIIPLNPVKYEESLAGLRKDELTHRLKEEAVKLYKEKEAEFNNSEAMREMERVLLLKAIDEKWMNHIDDMEQLRQGIGLQSLGQRDPLVEYKLSAYQMFDDMIAGITEETVQMIYHVRIQRPVEREQTVKITGTNKDDSAKRAPVKKKKEPSPNDPCPCGSGKKYKQCCGRNK